MVFDVVKDLFLFSEWVSKARAYFRQNVPWALARAATQNKKVRIRYKGKEFLVSPYSYRKLKGGDALFAYDHRDHRTKSFYVSDIEGVYILGSHFRPRWEVELV